MEHNIKNDKNYAQRDEIIKIIDQNKIDFIPKTKSIDELPLTTGGISHTRATGFKMFEVSSYWLALSQEF